MKRISVIVVLAVMTASTYAQDTYINDRTLNTSDVIGSARYVGMGGAMGALGADISVMSNNPAGIGLFRKSDVSFTLGGQIQGEQPIDGESRGTFSFDQAGVVFSFDTDSEVRRVNLGFNYQKKANFNGNFLTGGMTNSLSQVDQFAYLSNRWGYEEDGQLYFPSGSIHALFNEGLFGLYDRTDANGKTLYQYFANDYASSNFLYSRLTRGSLQGYDFNISFNALDQYFFGLTVGIDHLDYSSQSIYTEYNGGNGRYRLYQNQDIKGHGVNVKLGSIIRPYEDNPFRFGVTLETPTFYALNTISTLSLMAPNADYKFAGVTSQRVGDDNYLEYNVRSPWKFRAALGSTVDTWLAWDVEYEYALNGAMKMGYPHYSDSYEGQGLAMDKDKEMNTLTQNTIKGVHNIRAGIEVKPVSQVAVRAGYNLYSSPFKKNARLNQDINSLAMEYTTSTDFMNLGAANILTFGVGYHGKHFYADVAYKYRHQNAKFYAFDDSFVTADADFVQDNPNAAGATLNCTEVLQNRHNIAVTLGLKF